MWLLLPVPAHLKKLNDKRSRCYLYLYRHLAAPAPCGRWRADRPHVVRTPGDAPTLGAGRYRADVSVMWAGQGLSDGPSWSGMVAVRGCSLGAERAGGDKPGNGIRQSTR